MKFKLEESQIAIRPTVDEGAIVDLSFIIIGIANKDNNIQQATIYATSETNSYGIVLNGWYDGKAEPYGLYRGGFLNVQIPKLERFEYLEKTCKHSSFYECMGEQFKTHNMF